MASAETAPPKHTNRLVTEHSLYLRQHAHNPVDWFPWGAQTEEGAFFAPLTPPFQARRRFRRRNGRENQFSCPLAVRVAAGVEASASSRGTAPRLVLSLVPRDGARELRERGRRSTAGAPKVSISSVDFVLLRFTSSVLRLLLTELPPNSYLRSLPVSCLSRWTEKSAPTWTKSTWRTCKPRRAAVAGRSTCSSRRRCTRFWRARTSPWTTNTGAKASKVSSQPSWACGRRGAATWRRPPPTASRSCRKHWTRSRRRRREAAAASRALAPRWRWSWTRSPSASTPSTAASAPRPRCARIEALSFHLHPCSLGSPRPSHHPLRPSALLLLLTRSPLLPAQFPRPAELAALLADGSPHALRMTGSTLRALTAGGVHDHVGGRVPSPPVFAPLHFLNIFPNPSPLLPFFPFSLITPQRVRPVLRG